VPGRINEEDIQLLRERADIAAVIGAYTSLGRAGGGRLKGLCPLHDEKTPSFNVDPARGMWHCFGCGVGGDVYDFLQRVEALAFPEAVERLARLSAYTLRYEELSPGQRRALGRRTRLAEAVAEAADFYVAQLAGPEGAPAREYLAGRGLRPADIDHFRLGWAPDSWDGLARHLLGRGFEASELVDAGLVTHGRQGPVDRFRGRVIFPISDRSGRDVVAFGGRILPGVTLQTAPRDGAPPKYINSSETELYRKSEVLYALNWARADIQRLQTALVVEGYMDVIALHVAGIRHAVATCGTALTVEHFRQLERFARRVVLALDADDAGYTAADRARRLAEEAGLREIGVLPLPAGQDPADLAAAGSERLHEALEATKTAVQFQIEHLLRGADVTTPEGQVEAYRLTFPLLARLDDRFLRYTYIRDVVAPAVRLPADRVEAELDAHLASAAPAPATASSASSPAGRERQVVQLGGVTPPSGRPADPQLLLERLVLAMALQHPDLLPLTWAKVEPGDFTAPVSRQLFEALTAGDGPPMAQGLGAVLDRLPDDDARARVRALALSEQTVTPEAGHVAELVARLRAAAVQRRIHQVQAWLAANDPSSDPDAYRSEFARSVELERHLRELQEQREA
jgi:DNA primase